jgi:hypothetical protein
MFANYIDTNKVKLLNSISLVSGDIAIQLTANLNSLRTLEANGAKVVQIPANLKDEKIKYIVFFILAKKNAVKPKYLDYIKKKYGGLNGS